MAKKTKGLSNQIRRPLHNRSIASKTSKTMQLFHVLVRQIQSEN